MIDKLKPCPFCGGNVTAPIATKCEFQKDDTYFIFHDCLEYRQSVTIACVGENRQAAINNWNSRCSHVDALQAEIDRLKEENEKCRKITYHTISSHTQEQIEVAKLEQLNAELIEVLGLIANFNPNIEHKPSLEFNLKRLIQIASDALAKAWGQI